HFVDHVDNSARIHPPQAEDARQHDNRSACLKGRILRIDLCPRPGKHLPPAQCRAGRVERRSACPQCNAVVVEIVSGSSPVAREPDLGVGIALRTLRQQEAIDLLLRRFPQMRDHSNLSDCLASGREPRDPRAHNKNDSLPAKPPCNKLANFASLLLKMPYGAAIMVARPSALRWFFDARIST